MQSNINVSAPIDFSVAQDGEWMTITDAATAVQVAPQTIRRYVKSKKLRSRRRGRNTNSKLEVFVTADFRRNAVEEVDFIAEDIEEEDLESTDEVLSAHDVDYTDQSTRETMSWLRERMDDKDEQIKALTHQLMSASHRNGYLESQVKEMDDKVKLLTDSQSKGPEKNLNWWSRFCLWAAGVKEEPAKKA